MEHNHMYLLSAYLRKWSFADGRISFNYSFCMNDQYVRNQIDMRISAPLNMMNEILNHSFHRAKELVSELAEESDAPQDFNYNIVLVSESEVRQKLSSFLSKMLHEYNNNKRSHGRQRMIATRSLDFYYNDYEFEPLPDEIKFYVHLNRGANKISGDLWSNAVDDLSLALAIWPNNVLANRYMAKALNKLNRFEDALTHLRIYAEADKSIESLEDLASAYVHINAFKEAEAVYSQIEKEFPESPIGTFGKAQIAYKQGKGYKTLLDRLYKQDPDWLTEKLKKDWDYKLPGYSDDESQMWNAAIAARYLGFERPFDLTKKAFSNELPSYFDPDKGTIRFVKQELDAWVELTNRYKMEEVDYQTFEDRLTPEELKKAKARKYSKTRKKSTKVAAETV